MNDPAQKMVSILMEKLSCTKVWLASSFIMKLASTRALNMMLKQLIVTFFE
jgi:hypothetical protein